MKVFIANFGRENYEWPICLQRGTIATMNEVEVQRLWEAGDREGYIQRRMKDKTVAGLIPTRPVASRWFNLMTIISQSSGDIWIHRQKDEFWWTMSRENLPTFEEKVEPIARGRRVVVCHKPCDPWTNKTRKGQRLDWAGLHAKAREFLFTEGTLQQLTDDNAAYAVALLAGEDLTPWHSRPWWQKKLLTRTGKGGPVTNYNPLQKAAYRMAHQAFSTAAHSNGQEVTRTLKNKDIAFGSPNDLEKYIIEMYDMQEGLCALTELPLQIDGEEEDKELLCSLDRIDSSGHYAPGNLQLVCRFANRWKSDGDNEDFRRLVRLLRAHRGTDYSAAA
ncbi:hypothetical protein [Methylorubrum aminovorans]|uniref:hypothetical protein n=1 Tax=Methylorubrum aminovorans TaxID=269069 RepID=UPI003C2DC9B5